MATTPQEVWQLLGELAQAQKETERRFQETERLLQEQAQEAARRFQEAEHLLQEQAQEAHRRSQEADRRFQETEHLLQEQAQEAHRRSQEADRRAQEADRRAQEADRRQKAIDRQLQELGQQIGGLGKKFGSFTEGLALPSMETILRQQFGMEVVTPSTRVSKQGRHLQLDVLAYANGDVNTAIVVEVKSHARPESIPQLITQLRRFREFFPEHQDKNLYGILAAVDISDALKAEVLKAGLYVARIRDEVFELDTPASFQPRNW